MTRMEISPLLTIVGGSRKSKYSISLIKWKEEEKNTKS